MSKPSWTNGVGELVLYLGLVVVGAVSAVLVLWLMMRWLT